MEKDLKAIRGAGLLRKMVSEGEHEHQDFKFAISDACKIARSISAFANNDGGRLLIGVKDNGTIAGVRNEEDVYVVEQAAERYCRPGQKISFSAYRMDASVHVIVAEIRKAPERPVYAIDTDGSAKAYYRVADENIAAHPLMVKAWQRGNTPLALSQRHAVILDLIAARGCDMDAAEIAIALHIPVKSAEETIIDLASASLVDFRHASGSFKICLK